MSMKENKVASVALGTVVFERSAKLKTLLKSVDSDIIDKVYVGDNGDVGDRTSIYSNEYPFELEVLDLEYDCGLGKSRAKIVDSLSEDHLLIVDNDMTFPPNVDILSEQLHADEDLGGVSGVLWEDNSVRSGCWDIFEEGIFGNESVVYLDIREQKNIQSVAGHPVINFDFITNAAMFRAEALDDYSWDPALPLQEHLDFYVGHYKQTEWEFGVCPRVIFRHSPGGDRSYTNHRENQKRIDACNRYFLNKWGYRKKLRGRHHGWLDSTSSMKEIYTMKKIIKNRTPPQIHILYDDIFNTF
jgi:hypothetical protein